MKSIFASFFAALMLSVCAAPAAARIWKDQTGSFSIEAEFVHLKDDKVYLEKTDGSVIGVPIEKLSYADYDFLRTLKSDSAVSRYLRERPLPSEHTVYFVPKLQSKAESLSFSPDGRLLAVASSRGVMMLDLEKPGSSSPGQFDPRLKYHSECKFTGDGTKLITSNHIQGKIGIWRVSPTGALSEETIFDGPNRRVRSMAFSRDGRFMLTGDERHHLCYWDLSAGRMVHAFEYEFRGHVEGCFVNPKGTQALGTDGEWIVLYDLNSGKPVQKMKLTDANVYRAALSADGRRVAAVYSDTVYTWDTQLGTKSPDIKPHGSGPIWRLECSPNGKYLLIARTGMVDLWDMQNQRHVCEFSSSSGSNISGNRVRAR